MGSSALSSADPGELDLGSLRDHLVSRGVRCSGRLRSQSIPGRSSIHNVIVFDDSSTWFLRRPAPTYPPFMAGNIFRDYQMICALWGSAVPVARPVAKCSDPSALGFPFTLVDYVPGLMAHIDRDLPSLGGPQTVTGCVTSLLLVLAELHSIRPATVGFTDPDLPEDHLSHQVHWWADQWRHLGHTEGPCRRDGDRLQRALADGAPAPTQAAIVHGQFRIDNAILAVDDTTVVRAIVDWKGAAIGDPLTDIALTCAYRDRAADGIHCSEPAANSADQMPTAAEIAEQYSRISGRPLTDWAFHTAFAYFKLATLAAVLGQYRDGQISGRTTDMVGPLLSTGLAALGATD